MALTVPLHMPTRKQANAFKFFPRCWHSPCIAALLVASILADLALSRPCFSQLTHIGGAIGFYSGNVQELLDDVLVLRPHVSGPRLCVLG